MRIIVTGTPGAGKTMIAKALAKKYKLEYVDLSKLIKEKKLYEKYDKKLKTYIVDIKKIKQILIKIAKEDNIIIDSHLSHYLSRKYVDLCIVAKCDLPMLKKRLEKRKYPKLKIRENLDSEIFDVCLVEAKEQKHKIKIIDTTKMPPNLPILTIRKKKAKYSRTI